MRESLRRAGRKNRPQSHKKSRVKAQVQHALHFKKLEKLELI